MGKWRDRTGALDIQRGTPFGDEIAAKSAERVWRLIMRPHPESELSRRNFVLTAAAAGLASFAIRPRSSLAAIVRTDVASLPAYGNGTLPSGIRSRTVSDLNGLDVHLLESGFDPAGRPAVLLLHGFPELAYSWRKVMLPLAAAGYHVMDPDRRGFGRTTGWDDAYDGDLDPFGSLNQVRDALALVSAFGYRSVSAVVGHDLGSRIAAWCSLIRPDVFRSVVMMSAPFPGPPTLPFNSADHTKPNASAEMSSGKTIDEQLAALDPPRKYYQRYYTTRAANADMQNAPQGLHAFLRAYYHVKSADWKQNNPFPLKANTAEERAKMPTYYVMDLDKGMAETVASQMPSASEIAACKWLTEDELRVYAAEYARTGFQGGLQVYRTYFDSKLIAELRLFSDRTIDVPSCFIAGKSDWGVYQTPGALETMRSRVCTEMRGVHLIEGAGHWVQQEQPERVSELLVQFLKEHASRDDKT
jgi:pimeloyl-ACP methyl ester carboxylesterase